MSTPTAAPTVSAPPAPSPATAPPPRVLVIDDNELIHEDFRKTLNGAGVKSEGIEEDEAALFGAPAGGTPADGGPQYRIDSAMQGKEGLELVERAVAAGDPYSVAFVDMRMPPGWDGVQTIERLWKCDPNLQVVICTAYTDYSWAQVTRQLGRTDRLLILKKPFDDMEVCQLALSLTEKWRLRRQALLKLEQLEQMVQCRTAELQRTAQEDALTGLPNRARFNDLLGRVLGEYRVDSAAGFAVLFLDIDRFKVVNDSLGHLTGDLLLKSIAQRLRDVLKEVGEAAPDFGRATAARLGGDEFVVLLEKVRDANRPVEVARRILEALSRPQAVNGHEVQATASIGIAPSHEGYRSAEEVLRDADNAMYRAKSAGKGCYVVFDRRMHDEAIARLTTENELRHALSAGELTLHYQPIFNLDDRALVGFEALVRWNHPTRGLVPPAEFVPLAEEIGLIAPLGDWVLRRACLQLRQWHLRRPDYAHLSVNVNVSRGQLISRNLLYRVREALQESGLRPGHLHLEITESSIMQNAGQAIELLKNLKLLGVHLHMDDFGTGYSSLSCLHRFPLDAIKIDRSFIQNVGERHDYAAVVHAIVTVARNLGMEVIAEGVETPDQLVMLQALECGKAQGYLFARPLTPEAAAGLIDQQPPVMPVAA